MRIHFRYLNGARLRDYERSYVPTVIEELQRYDIERKWRVVDDPEQADLVVLWESYESNTPAYIDALEADPVVRNASTRLVAVNYNDHAEGFLAGVYVSVEAPFFDPNIHASWPFFQMANTKVYDLDRERLANLKPRWLFSFTGAASHAMRRRLFQRYSEAGGAYHVQHIKKWYNHGAADQQHFVDVALASTFCLCPQGYSAYSPRIAEVMAMARVPVIIADAWIPFSFEEDTPYYIRISEADVDRIPEILEARLGEVETLRWNARRLWEKYCSRERRVPALVERLAKLAFGARPLPTFEEYRARWRSREFLEKAGWTPRQMFALRLEQRLHRFIPGIRVPGVSGTMRYRNAAGYRGGMV